LLQVIIGSGCKDAGTKQIAKHLNAAIQKAGIGGITIEDIKGIKGIGVARATAIFASIEFFRRKFTKQDAPTIDSPERAAMQVEFISKKKQEHFVLLTLDGARRLINCHTVSIGTLLSSQVHPREVFALAVEDRAASIIVSHNHPSGVLSISEEDYETTRRLQLAGELLGIPLDDHIIVAGGEFVSAR
jgi:DNA repair protein RadC